MVNDKTTLRDLSIFGNDGADDLFSRIALTTTQAGKEVLKKHVTSPPDTLEKLVQVRDAVRFWSENPDVWPKVILNGTIVMLEAYFESADGVSRPPAGLSMVWGNAVGKMLHGKAYSSLKFSLSHLADFLKGCLQIAALADRDDLPEYLAAEVGKMRHLLEHRLTPAIIRIDDSTGYSELVHLNFGARREMKSMVSSLIALYAGLDALRGMAEATRIYGFVFPELLPDVPVRLAAEGLYHPLLRQPTAYDIASGDNRNLMILTGANMAGKTTFLRALGIAGLLAHLGMGVPAQHMQISFLHGIITNMHVNDDILKGESYFLAEVHRMKMTAERLNSPKPHMVLMDELFKGTNVHDAYECTKAVVEGLLQSSDHMMFLSTHLYEVASQFEHETKLTFACFITQVRDDGGFNFTYRLEPGISNDRIGFRILQQEGVIALLQRRKPEG
jgi:DNA mismatch repair protein MutS